MKSFGTMAVTNCGTNTQLRTRVLQLSGVAILLLLVNASYSANYEIPLDALLGNHKSFTSWRQQFQKWYLAQIDSISSFSPTSHSIINIESVDGITLLTIQYHYPRSSLLYNKPGGGILAIHKNNNPKLPLIIAIHGHEHSPWGEHAISLFKDRSWPYQLAMSGYTVWTPVSMYHDEIQEIANDKEYPLTWAKIISDGLDYGQKHIWPQHASNYVTAGLSAGALTAYVLMAYRSDIYTGVFAGAEQNLDFLRREYRIKGHPDCWDIRGINSYTTIKSLLAPRPIQFQVGKKDPFYPNGIPLKSQGKQFNGTSRAPISTEPGGDALAIKSIYELLNKKEGVSYYIHNGGHEFRADEALRFIRRNPPPH